MRRFTDMQRRQDQLQRDMSIWRPCPVPNAAPDTERDIRAEMEQLSAQINTLGDTLSQQDIPFEAMYQTKPLSWRTRKALLLPQEALVIFDIGPEVGPALCLCRHAGPGGMAWAACQYRPEGRHTGFAGLD
ncbi:MAG: hypothetical protein R3D81_09705 [Thalassovita sp.]